MYAKESCVEILILDKGVIGTKASLYSMIKERILPENILDLSHCALICSQLHKTKPMEKVKSHNHSKKIFNTSQSESHSIN